jgi:hypothetical protein
VLGWWRTTVGDFGSVCSLRISAEAASTRLADGTGRALKPVSTGKLTGLRVLGALTGVVTGSGGRRRTGGTLTPASVSWVLGAPTSLCAAQTFWQGVVVSLVQSLLRSLGSAWFWFWAVGAPPWAVSVGWLLVSGSCSGVPVCRFARSGCGRSAWRGCVGGRWVLRVVGRSRFGVRVRRVWVPCPGLSA